MANDGIKPSPAPTVVPPRTLNVQQFLESRASELETLHSIVANRSNNDLSSQRNKRRRTTSYENRLAKRRFRKNSKVGVVGASKDGTLLTEEKKAPRWIRRRIELRKNLQHGFLTSGDGTKRLRTHVWHAKRFTMTKLWGFHLPFGLHGRGRGSRALLKWLKHGVLVHDASYYNAIQLDGPEDLLLSILREVLVPSPLACSEDISHSMLSGVIYGSAVLHHVGASFSPAIAPVTYMWRPFLQQCRGGDADGHPSDEHDKAQQANRCSSSRQLWIWLHAAAFREGYDALNSACQRQMEITGRSVDCVSLEGRLANIEVLGSRTFELLRKIIHPSEREGHLKRSIFENEDQIHSSAIIALKVFDPRALPNKGVAVIPEETSSGLLDVMQKDEVKGKMVFTGISKTKTKSDPAPCLKFEEGSDLSELDLWDACKGIHPPVEESVLSMEKHEQRLTFFGFDKKSSDTLGASNQEQCSRWCPIILLKNNSRNGSLLRWSIMLPLCWLKVFWITLVASGAHAIGLRERNWISSEAGVPCFPVDFLDCNAYYHFMETEAASSDKKAILRPPSMRPARVPIPPPWHCIQFSLKRVCMKTGEIEMHPEELCVKNAVYDKSLTELDLGNCDVAAVGGQAVPFDGFVARTSFMLTNFLNDINGDHLLLFPELCDRKKCIMKFMKDEKILSQNPNKGISLINCNKRCCFVRVFLHAFKEGVFEEGAVVCAPYVTDITLWTSRSETDEKLQISESSMTSYFVQQPSGKWELKVPEDSVARVSYRWPIGFVTSGFVRGSKKPTAVAFCEVVSLAHLREEQWRAVHVKKRKEEIYVLVRNLRSTAYRLARAAIVLEQQQLDVEYM